MQNKQAERKVDRVLEKREKVDDAHLLGAHHTWQHDQFFSVLHGDAPQFLQNNREGVC